MSTQQPAGNQGAPGGNAQHGDASASVGHATSGEAGATPDHETMGETGGSGGAGLTATQVAESGQPTQAGAAPNRQGLPPSAEPQGAPPVVVDSGARGAQDTRSRQAGGTETGLGVPETGANQAPADLGPGRSGKPRA